MRDREKEEMKSEQVRKFYQKTTGKEKQWNFGGELAWKRKNTIEKFACWIWKPTKEMFFFTGRYK